MSYHFTSCFYNVSDWDKRGANQYVAYQNWYSHKYKRIKYFRNKILLYFFLIVYCYIITRNV